MASALFHGLAIAIAVGLTLRAPETTRHTTFITLEPYHPQKFRRMPAYAGSATKHGPTAAPKQAKAAPPPVAALAPVVAAPEPAPLAVVDSTTKSRKALTVGAAAALAFPRSSSDNRIWAVPRQSLPKDVADALYIKHDSLNRDTVVTRRLRAMVDSMNKLMDLAARDHKAPSWTTDIGGMKFGMDSANIYLAGIKIPTPVLALLGSALPQGNFDESMRDRQMADIQRDIWQAAQRAKTMEEFRGYVREMRARKQAEHDAARAQRDSTHHTGPDTVRVIQ
jgi:hypothetical protein